MNIENSNKKLMLVTVGVGAGDGRDIAHGLYYTIDHCNPDIVLFIASQDSWNKISPFLIPELQKKNKHIEIPDPAIVTEIDNFDRLNDEFTAIIQQYIKCGYNASRMIADYTSGTKAMSAAMVSSAIFNGIGKLTYVTGDRENGRVVSGTERQFPLETLKYVTQNKINDAVKFFNENRYITAIKILESAESHKYYSNLVEQIIKLSRFLDYWDKFAFSRAFEEYKSINKEQLKLLGVKDVEAMIGLLGKLKDTTLNLEKVDDLLFNSARRAQEGKYDDAAARIYRAVEMLAQIEFEAEFKCSTSSIKLENLPEKVRLHAEQNCLNKNNDFVQAGLFQTFQMLALNGNKTGILFTDNLIDFRKLLDIRNNSILAHGANPISKDDFDKFYSFVTEKFSVADKGKRNPEFKFPIIKKTL
jgi:CRISPR-associated protein (TIGR02710 family)